MPAIKDYKDDAGMWVKSYTLDKTTYRTKSYVVWCGIINRTTIGNVSNTHNKAYNGCTVSEEFKDFQNFAVWYTEQIGYLFAGYDLDKDILGFDCKTYSRQNCVLVPRSLNSFMALQDRHRGEYPLGVTLRKETGMFRVQMNIDGILYRFGQYSTPEEAHEVYKVEKKREALAWHDWIIENNMPLDPRVLSILKNMDVNNYC